MDIHRFGIGAVIVGLILAIIVSGATAGYTSCDQLDLSLLQEYDANQNSLIDDGEISLAAYDLARGTITQPQYNQIEYAWANNCSTTAGLPMYLYLIIAIIVIIGVIGYIRRTN